MGVQIGDTLSQIGSGVYRLVKGKDVDINQAKEELASGDLHGDDLLLVDDVSVGPGTQDSTKKIKCSSLLTYINDNITGGDLTMNGSVDNGILTYGGATTIDNDGQATLNGSSLHITENNTGPTLTMVNRNAGIYGSRILFKKDSESPADDDRLGRITWYGNVVGATGANTSFAEMICYANEVDDASDSGLLEIKVSTNSAGLKNGIKLIGRTSDNLVGVDLGYGAASITALAGKLRVNGNSILDDDGAACVNFDSSGNTEIVGDLTVTGNDIKSGTDGALNLSAEANMQFTIDSDDGAGTNSFKFYDYDSVIAELDKDGNLSLSGDITVKGGDIKSHTDSSLTLDSEADMTFVIDSDDGGTNSFVWKDHDYQMMALKGSVLEISDNVNDVALSPVLLFKKDTGANAVDNQTIGSISFQGENDAQQTVHYGNIVSSISDASDGSEKGSLTFGVASYDGEMVNGLSIVSGGVEDEIDITLGNGSLSTCVVNGWLNVTSGISFDSVNIDNLLIGGDTFQDVDSSLMTAAAIKDQITSQLNSEGLSMSGTTADGILTYSNSSTASVESQLRFNPGANELLFGLSSNNDDCKIKRTDRTNNGSGGDFDLVGQNGYGADSQGGEVNIVAGLGTGQGRGGNIDFYSHGVDASAAGGSSHPTRIKVGQLSAEGDFAIGQTTGARGYYKGTNIGTILNTAIYLTPADFHVTSVSRSDGTIYTNDDGGSVRPNSASHNYHAMTYVPLGYKVTDVDVKGSNTSGSYEVFVGQWDSDSTQSKGSVAIGSTLDLSSSSSDWVSVEGEYIIIQWDPAGSTDELYGAKITIGKA